MDLSQLANLGEFIGGVAVLVTLVYLAIQVQQGTAAQKAAAAITAGEAVRKTIGAFSTYRQMIAEESIGELWAKAKNDEQLSIAEEVRLQAVVDEAGWIAASAIESLRATGNDTPAEILPASLALELGNSETMRRAWDEHAQKLRFAGFSELADRVAAGFVQGKDE